MIQLFYRWMQNLAVYMLLVTAFCRHFQRIATEICPFFLRTSSDSSCFAQPVLDLMGKPDR